ncbi:hypothetical protein VNO77_23991 [Canavalia gladiata]|uniref:Uncharacterized protein n=1 Tax=Canavalia gladiata TaxID=3824 RepID=A0AAN9QC24_CANGL
MDIGCDRSGGERISLCNIRGSKSLDPLSVDGQKIMLWVVCDATALLLTFTNLATGKLCVDDFAFISSNYGQCQNGETDSSSSVLWLLHDGIIN